MSEILANTHKVELMKAAASTSGDPDRTIELYKKMVEAITAPLPGDCPFKKD